MLSEVVHLQSVMEELGGQSKDPFSLPPASEQVILDIKGQDVQWSYVSLVVSLYCFGRPDIYCSSHYKFHVLLVHTSENKINPLEIY